MDKALQTMIDNMPEKTGKSLQEWKTLLAKETFEKHGQAVAFLKTEYGVTHGFANTIVTLSKDANESSDDLLANQYKGREQLLPIYEQLIAAVNTFGGDVKIVPKKSTVSIVRKRQFALIKPATKTRIDLGLKFNEKPTAGRLENSGPFGSMCSHRVQLIDAGEVDAELIGWLKEAYEAAS